MKQTILVIGGAGYIGSHINKQLNEEGYQTVVFDNLSIGNQESVTQGTFIKGELADLEQLDAVFRQYRIDAVMHFAALTDVGESAIDPFKYYQNNVCRTLNLLQAMKKNGVDVLIFSSTAAIFGVPQTERILESHPKHPINPYGKSKLMVEEILADANKAYGLRFCCLRYFNAAGGDPSGEVKNFKHKENNLIPIILRDLKSSNPTVTIFGTDYPTHDGTCIRDYIHVHDLGTAHIQALRQLLAGSSATAYNLGNGRGFSVKEVISAVERVTKISITAKQGKRRPGDPPILVADASKAIQELNWHPRYPSLDEMISHAWTQSNI